MNTHRIARVLAMFLILSFFEGVPSRNVLRAKKSAASTHVRDANPLTITLYGLGPAGSNSIYESAPMGSFVGYFQVSDGLDSTDDTDITCVLDNDDFALVEIFPNEYQLLTAQVLDFEAEVLVHVIITCRHQDQPTLSTDKHVTVHVMDVNDNVPIITVNSLSASGQAEIVENSPPGSFVAHVGVFDADSGKNGEVTCMIDNYDFTLIPIHDTEFKIVTARVFDREHESHAVIEMQCQDRGMPVQSTISQIEINILDVNDNMPVFLHPQYHIGIWENTEIGTLLVQVMAYDADEGRNGYVTYSLTNDNAFSIDSVSGLISNKVVLDYEQVPSLEFAVVATDQGVPPLSSTATVIVHVFDIVDE